jgi:Ca-activated chloride channel family protein
MFELTWGNGAFRWVLLVIPALIGLYGGYWWWKGKVAASLGRPRLLAWRSGRKQVLRFALLMASLALLILAVARPQWGERQRKVTREGIDLVLALDISKSMLAADVNPSRLRAAKDELIRALEQLRGDRVGLVVFTGVSFAQSPLTGDYGAIRFYLRKLDPEDMPVGGTASGRALLDSVELLTGERLGRAGEGQTAPTHEKAFKRARTQVIVLVTDGEDHQGDPVSAARVAAERGIRVYTVGFGSDKGEPIPVYDKEGRLQGYQKDRRGNTVYTRLNEEPLRQIAELTGGQYFHYEGQGSMANAITSTLNTLEKEELEALLRVEYEERFPLFLYPGLLLLLLATLLGDRRGLHLDFWRQWRGLQALWPLVAVAAASLLQGCEAAHEVLVMRKVAAVEQGNVHIAAGEGDKALERYKVAESSTPASPELHYDLGIGFLEAGQFDQATASLSRALESPREELRFMAHFNLGVAWYRQEKWAEALEAFKGALRLRPEDHDAKVAFEVTLAKVYPPCAALEDKLEENDARDAASPLQEPQKELSLCGGDEDWFAAQLYPGSILRAEANFKRLRQKEPGDPALLPQEDALRLVMFAPDGESILTLSDKEPADGPNAAKPLAEREGARRVLGPLRLTPEMLQVAPGQERALAPGLLRVVADEGLEFQYDLKVEVIPPCFALQEESEDNGAADKAAPMPPLQGVRGESAMHVCEGDEDWMRLELGAGETLFVDVIAALDAETQTVPTLEVALIDESGAEIQGEVEVVPSGEGVLYGVSLRDAATARDLRLRVRSTGEAKQGPYKVQVFRYPPCPEGDDWMEQNDAREAPADFPPGQEPVRHLRLCPGDADWFKIAAKKEDRIVLGLHHDQPAAADGATPGQVGFRLWNEAGDTVVADGASAQAPAAPDSPLQQAVSTDKLEEDKTFLLEVSASDEAARFYDLLPLDGNSLQQEQQQQQQQQDQGDQGDQEEEQPQEQPPQDGEPQEEEEEPKEAEPAPGEPQDEEEAREAQIEEILENLEESDDNFQLKKALESAPERYIENDW